MSKSTHLKLPEEKLVEQKPAFENMVWIPGGAFMMGSDKHYPEEAPAHEVTVDGFWMDRHTVTNEEVPPLCRGDQARDIRRARTESR